MLFRAILRRLGNRHLAKRLAKAKAEQDRLSTNLAKLAAEAEVLRATIELQEGVIARERARVRAETQIHARMEANARKA